MAKRFYNVDPTPDNFRALWDRIHDLTDQVAAEKLKTAANTDAVAAAQVVADTAHRAAQEALLTAGQTVAAVANTPPPSPPAPVDTFTYADHLPDVLALYAIGPPAGTVEGAFKFTQALAWMFNAEMNDGVLFPMGLLVKTSGDNVYTCGGVDYSASRICYPNGKIFKVLGDVPTGNTPEWLDDGYVDLSRYHVATDPGVPC